MGGILFLGAVVVVAILFFRDDILVQWRRLTTSGQELNQDYGQVKSWNPDKGELIIELRSGGEMTYEIQAGKNEVVTFEKDENSGLNQVLVMNYDSEDWRTAFCPGDSVHVEYKVDEQGIYTPFRFTDQGPRICK